MNKVEQLFIEEMDRTNFMNVINDNFSFIDGLIDSFDIERINNKNSNTVTEDEV